VRWSKGKIVTIYPSALTGGPRIPEHFRCSSGAPFRTGDTLTQTENLGKGRLVRVRPGVFSIPVRSVSQAIAEARSMANPFTSNDLFRSLKNRFMKNHSSRDTGPTAINLSLIWPDGTWQFDDKKDFDCTIRGVLLDVYANEKFLAAEKNAGMKLNPGFFGQRESDVPAGWLPSESGIDHLWGRNNWVLKYRVYIVKRLREMNKLAA
jgi:hypothetical protein